jgi:hypothetical protein
MTKRSALESLARSYTLPYLQVIRAQVVLLRWRIQSVVATLAC